MPAEPAKFYLNSAPRMRASRAVKIPLSAARKVELGDPAQSNERTIYQLVIRKLPVGAAASWA